MCNAKVDWFHPRNDFENESRSNDQENCTKHWRRSQTAQGKFFQNINELQQSSVLNPKTMWLSKKYNLKLIYSSMQIIASNSWRNSWGPMQNDRLTVQTPCRGVQELKITQYSQNVSMSEKCIGRWDWSYCFTCLYFQTAGADTPKT